MYSMAFTNFGKSTILDNFTSGILEAVNQDHSFKLAFLSCPKHWSQLESDDEYEFIVFDDQFVEQLEQNIFCITFGLQMCFTTLPYF